MFHWFVFCYRFCAWGSCPWGCCPITDHCPIQHSRVVLQLEVNNGNCNECLYHAAPCLLWENFQWKRNNRQKRILTASVQYLSIRDQCALLWPCFPSIQPSIHPSLHLLHIGLPGTWCLYQGIGQKAKYTLDPGQPIKAHNHTYSHTHAHTII